MHALLNISTYKFIDLPQEKDDVGCHQVFNVKYPLDDTIQWLKAWLVDKGYIQTYSMDYLETFSPIAHHNSICILISLAINFGWCLYQLDVKNTFLYDNLSEEVYMEQPPWFGTQGKPRVKVCKLNKTLYG